MVRIPGSRVPVSRRQDGYDASHHDTLAGYGAPVGAPEVRKACLVLMAQGDRAEPATAPGEVAHFIAQILGAIPTPVSVVRDPITREVKQVKAPNLGR